MIFVFCFSSSSALVRHFGKPSQKRQRKVHLINKRTILPESKSFYVKVASILISHITSELQGVFENIIYKIQLLGRVAPFTFRRDRHYH